MKQDYIDAICKCCGKSKKIRRAAYKLNTTKNNGYRCLSCANSQSNRPRPPIKLWKLIEVKCTACGNVVKVKKGSFDRNIRNNGKYICRRKGCVGIVPHRPNPHNTNKLIEWCKSDEGRAEASARAKRMWANKRSELIAAIREKCKDPETIQKKRDACRIKKDPELLAKCRALWKTEEYRNKVSIAMKNVWNSPGYKEKMASIRSSSNSHVSKIQEILYSILDDLGIEYYRERNDGHSDPQCVIGPWSFDCVVPRAGKTTLLIECQGDYWHSLPGKESYDTSKASYISNNFPNQYELKCLWEHEFYTKDKIRGLIEYWTGISN